MLREIFNTKWYWWIPFVYLLFVPRMVKWAFEPEKLEDKLNRDTLVNLMMFPTLLIACYIVLTYL